MLPLEANLLLIITFPMQNLYQTVYMVQKYGRTLEEQKTNKKILWKQIGESTNQTVNISLVDDNNPFLIEFDHDGFLGWKAVLKFTNISFVGCG